MNLLQLIRYYDSETQQHLKIRIIEEVASDWEEVAGQLGFTPAVIVAVKNPGCGKTPDACFKEILRRWMANATGMPNADKYPCTWKGIHTLLIDTTHTTVANDLKEAIEATYTDFKKTYDEGILHFRSTYRVKPSACMRESIIIVILSVYLSVCLSQSDFGDY